MSLSGKTDEVTSDLPVCLPLINPFQTVVQHKPLTDSSYLHVNYTFFAVNENSDLYFVQQEYENKKKVIIIV